MTGVPDLSGRVVIVTGASRGIGKGLAIGLAALGAAVVCAARIVEVASPAACPARSTTPSRAIEAAGGTALAVRCDIGDDADIQHLVDDDRRAVRPPRRAREQRDDAHAGAVRGVDGRRSGTSRCASTCAASTCSRRPSRRTWPRPAAAASSTSRRAAPTHATHAVHAARLSHLLRGQGRARAVHERGRARARAARHHDERVAARAR